MVELIPGGANIKLTNMNKTDYIRYVMELFCRLFKSNYVTLRIFHSIGINRVNYALKF